MAKLNNSILTHGVSFPYGNRRLGIARIRRLQFIASPTFGYSSEKETRGAKAHCEQSVPTLEQINAVIRTMPVSTDVERRDRAVIAFILLSGARDGAVASLKVKHVDLAKKRVIQDAREVRTKFSKSSTTYFFPVGEGAERIVEDWICLLKDALLFGPDDPLFPKTQVNLDEVGHFAASGLARQHWSNAGPIRRIFKLAFVRNGLPYFGPHSFEKPLPSLVSAFAGPRKNSRHGART